MVGWLTGGAVAVTAGSVLSTLSVMGTGPLRPCGMTAEKTVSRVRSAVNTTSPDRAAGTPAGPVGPVAPAGPVAPVDPVPPGPVAPTGPVAPLGPVAPTGPVAPADPTPAGPVAPAG